MVTLIFLFSNIEIREPAFKTPSINSLDLIRSRGFAFEVSNSRLDENIIVVINHYFKGFNILVNSMNSSVMFPPAAAA